VISLPGEEGALIGETTVDIALLSVQFFMVISASPGQDTVLEGCTALAENLLYSGDVDGCHISFLRCLAVEPSVKKGQQDHV
jgi:hypothetical protein